VPVPNLLRGDQGKHGQALLAYNPIPISFQALQNKFAISERIWYT